MPSLGTLWCFEGAYTLLQSYLCRRGHREASLFTHRLTSLIGPAKGGVEDRECQRASETPFFDLPTLSR